MTPDQIKEAAIEAGRQALIDHIDNPITKDSARAFADAYEAAMWRPISEAPRDGTGQLFYTPQYRGRIVVASLYPDGQMEKHEAAIFTHFRPLPQPPVSAAIRAAGEE